MAIYIPHPTFRTDKAEGGAIVAYSSYQKHDDSDDMWSRMRRAAPEVGMFCEIDTEKLFSKFERAAQSKPGTATITIPLDHQKDLLYGFVREDGCEFAISPYKDHYRENFIGYWNIPYKLSTSDWETFGLLWLPVYMVEFLRWIENICPLKQ